MQEQVQQWTYSNGLTLLTQQMPHVRSATFAFHIPAGLSREAVPQRGIGTLLAELLVRGAGTLNSQELTTALDELGLDRSENIGLANLSLSAGTLARHVPAALRLYAEIVLRPHLPEEELDPAKELMLQDLAGLEDSPQEMVFLELKRQTYPEPFGRGPYGTKDSIESLRIEDVRKHYQNHFVPNGAILSVAGAIHPTEIHELVGELFGNWTGPKQEELKETDHQPQSVHLPKETQQTHIALSIPSAPFTDQDYYAARGLVGVLSGGMSSRLFTEVREKRGLCYTVSAGHDTAQSRGSLICYAGTRAERAQETLDVILQELKRIREGVTVEELDRVKASLKTALVMQQESTGARAAAMAGDWYYLKRIRPVQEIIDSVNALDNTALMNYLDRFPIISPVVVTLGSAPLNTPTA